MRKGTLRLVLLGTAATLLATGAQAQEANRGGRPGASDPSSPGEIIVTARKREESLQNVPVAVSVLSSNLLSNNLATDLTKMAELAPQVSVGYGSASATGALITIRGISTESTDAGLDQSVLVEIDDVPLSRGRIISASLYDLESVQVLKGPQALYFGKNSPAGVISLRSADPGSKFEGYVKAGYEFNADEAYSEGAVSSPIGPVFGARLAYRVSRQKGWMDNVAKPLPDVFNPAFIDPGAIWDRGPRLKDYAGRLTLVADPGDGFKARFKLSYNKGERDGVDGNTEPFCIGNTTSPVLAGRIPLPGADCALNQQKSQGGVAPQYVANIPYTNGGIPYARSNIWLGSLTLEKQFEKVGLTSTTGYYDQKTQQLNGFDWTPYSSIWAVTRDTFRLWTQELRLNTDFDGPLNFMIGGYYEHFQRDFFNAPDLFHTFNPVAQNYAYTQLQSITKGEYYSAFAELRFALTPTLELTGGARWSHDEKFFSGRNLTTIIPSLLPPGRSLQSRYSDNHVSPEATITWRPDPDNTLYAAFKTGYKGGGISNSFLLSRTDTPASLQFQPEEAKGGEVGYKARMFGGSLRLDLNAYIYDFKNLQVTSYDAVRTVFTLQNAAKARVKGLEGTAEWRANDVISLNGNFGYNRAEFLDFATARCFGGQTVAQGCVNARQDLSGKALNRAPRLTYSFGADLTPRLVDGLETAVTVKASHSSSYQSNSDYAPGGFQKGYWLLNASVKVGAEDGPWELSLIGRNLTNSYYRLFTIGQSGSSNNDQYVGTFNRPREVVLQGTIRW